MKCLYTLRLKKFTVFSFVISQMSTDAVLQLRKFATKWHRLLLSGNIHFVYEYYTTGKTCAQFMVDCWCFVLITVVMAVSHRFFKRLFSSEFPTFIQKFLNKSFCFITFRNAKIFCPKFLLCHWNQCLHESIVCYLEMCICCPNVSVNTCKLTKEAGLPFTAWK